jgi:hypothetical protein
MYILILVIHGEQESIDSLIKTGIWNLVDVVLGFYSSLVVLAKQYLND